MEPLHLPRTWEKVKGAVAEKFLQMAWFFALTTAEHELRGDSFKFII